MATPLAPNPLDADDNYDFEALYANIEQSIDRKKSETTNVRASVNALQQTVDDLNTRAAIVGRRIEREQQERQQDIAKIRDQIKGEMTGLDEKLEQEKEAQAEREAAAL